MGSELAKRCTVRRSAIHGWGLFADAPEPTDPRGWRAGDILDESPLEIVSEYGDLADHVYCLDDGRFGLPKGDGIFANSSERPNAHWEIDLTDPRAPMVRIIADRRIRPGAEVTIAYEVP